MTEVCSTDTKVQGILGDLYIKQDLNFDETSNLLSELRVLTREKTLSPQVLDTKCLSTLVDYSTKRHIEAQKCLSNLILNYPPVRENLVSAYIACAEQHLQAVLNKTDTDEEGLNEVLYYDMRIIFLLSALCSSSQSIIRDRLADSIMKMTIKESGRLSQENHLLVIESLKTLFNLTLNKCLDIALATELIKKLFSLVGTEQLVSVEGDSSVTDQVLVNLIHLLTNMPAQVYQELSDEDADKILRHLDSQLKTYLKNSFRDTVLPILNVCANICRYNKSTRQRWFDEIIASTKQFDKRPEEYETLRGRLVKLMTSVDVHIKDIAAEFLYALCGDDTEKFITYTGFGNSAAFLSTRGLLSHAMKKTSESNGGAHPDENYEQLRTKLDPITGKLEAPKKNPMEGMSEEEKERHAEELAGAITRLTNLGIVKPMGIDSDGKISELHPQSSHKSDDD